MEISEGQFIGNDGVYGCRNVAKFDKNYFHSIKIYLHSIKIIFIR